MDNARWFYPDTSYIYGGFKSKALALKIRIKPKKKFKVHIKEGSQVFIDKGIKFVISELTAYEIKHTLMNEDGLTFSQANKVFQDRLKECPIYIELQCCKEIQISNNFLNWTLEKRLDLQDALHILTASRLSLYAITKEKYGKFEKWVNAYKDGVLSHQQFQETVSKLPKI